MLRVLIPIFTLIVGLMAGYSLAFVRLHDAVKEIQEGRPLTGSHPFPLVIEKTSGKPVLAVGAESDKVINVIANAADATIAAMNEDDSPIRGLRRINEASRFFEDSLLAQINANPEFACEIPKTSEGDAQRSGYPDLKITHLPTRTTYYLDPKLYEESSRSSSLRTFYYTPRTETSKIHEPARHLLIGFSHDGKDGDWTFLSWSLVDLSRTELTLKSEFNASNADLYQPETIVRSSAP